MLSTLQYDEWTTGFPPARLCLFLLLLPVHCDFGSPCPYNSLAIGKTRVASKTSETTSAFWWLLSNLSSLPSATKHQNISMFWGSKLFGQSHRFSNTIFCLATFVSAPDLTLPSASMPTRLDAIQYHEVCAASSCDAKQHETVQCPQGASCCQLCQLYNMMNLLLDFSQLGCVFYRCCCRVASHAQPPRLLRFGPKWTKSMAQRRRIILVPCHYIFTSSSGASA